MPAARLSVPKVTGKALVRFLSKIRFSISGCWEWRGAVSGRAAGRDYGRFRCEGRVWPAHRISYRLFNGDPGPLLCCHHCDNPRCVRPGHLFAGTDQDNHDDMCSKGRARAQDRSPICRRGHKRQPSGYCPQCARIDYRAKRPGPCSVCSRLRRIVAGGKCSRCYRLARLKVRRTCVGCQKRKGIEAKGMCEACYRAHRRAAVKNLTPCPLGAPGGT